MNHRAKGGSDRRVYESSVVVFLLLTAFPSYTLNIAYFLCFVKSLLQETMKSP